MEAKIQRTSFYSDCLGVFQGGGCRAAAFAGAFAEGYKIGVRFSEVAGTSAGSIIAALIAAGVDADALVERVRKLDFRSMLVPTSRPLFSDYGFRPPFLLRLFGRGLLRKVVINVQLVARRLLLETLGFWRWPEEKNPAAS